MCPVPRLPSLYVHIPFCRSKCSYCSFVSFGDRAGEADDYLAALEREAGLYHAQEAATVYVGGGTPSALSVPQLERLFAALRRHFLWSGDAEVTLEVNPATCDAAKARVLAQCGVNRVSLGLQSLQPANLAWLGRAHTAEEGRQAFALLREAGFRNIGVDIVYSLPGQTRAGILADIGGAMALGPEHLSCYVLGVDEGSRFHLEGVRANDPDIQARDLAVVWERLARSAWPPYEISNAAKPGYACRHNLNYWTGGDYIGLGIAAHSHRAGHRYWNTPDLASYLRAAAEDPRRIKAGEEFLDPARRLLETVLLGLRLSGGVDTGEAERRFGAALGERRCERIAQFIRDGFLIREGAFLKATDKGRPVLDEIGGHLM